MSAKLIAIVGLIYVYVAAEQWLFKNNPGMGITYFGYAVGNIGLYMLAGK